MAPCDSLQRMVHRVHLPVPRWIVGFFDPAQAYMERSRWRPPGWQRRRRRPARGGTGYAPLTSGGRPRRRSEAREPFVPPPEIQERLRRRVHEHSARRDEILDSLGPVLDDAVRELQEQGTTVVALPLGTLSARIVRFRWGDSVLEINRRPGTGLQVTGGSRTRLGRQDPERRAETLKHYLAGAVADLAADT